MGKRIIQQARGKGGPTYKSPSHRYVAKPKHRPYDKKEKDSIIYGFVKDVVNCPGHTAPLAIIKYDDNKKSYIIAPEKLYLNQKIASGAQAPIQTGNTLPLKNIPEGTPIYNIENIPGDQGKFVRSSGTSARIISKFPDKVIIRLPSKNQKALNPNCRATIGIVAGSGRVEKPIVKAGKKYHMAKAKNKLYPKTSAGAMNATDHPFGSGRGGPSFGGKSSSIAPRFAPPGRKVGILKPKRTGRKQ